MPASAMSSIDDAKLDATHAGATDRQWLYRVESLPLLAWIKNACGILSLPAQVTIPCPDRL